MHNFSTTGYAADSVMASNMGIINQGFDNVVYRHWVNASEMDDMQDASTPSYFLGSVGAYPPYWRLQDGAVTSVGFYVPRSKEWRCGAFGLVVHYSVSVGGGTIVWRTRVTPVTDSAAPSSTLVLFSENAPATANVFTSKELISADLSDSSQIDGSHVGVLVSVGRRDAGDTNAGAVHIYGVELVYRETRHVVGDRQ